MVKLQNTSKSYSKRVILNDISLEIAKGDMIALMGRSGAGKTTLLNILGLLEIPDRGEYYLDGNLIRLNNDEIVSRIRRDYIGFVVQNYGLLNDKKIDYNISLPLLIKKLKKDEIKDKVYETACAVGIEEHLNKYPYQLSGGECQRVSIARALIKNPKLILADEPTGALDEKSEQNIIQLLLELNRKGVTIVIATHNSEVANICKKIFYIKNENLFT